MIGRQYQHGFQDCYSLVRDYYREHFNLVLRNYARPDLWWETDMDLYGDLIRCEGFNLVPGQLRGLQTHDLITFKIGTRRVINHAAIYMGDGHILHHPYNRLSVQEEVKGIWRRCLEGVWRHESIGAKRNEHRASYFVAATPLQKRHARASGLPLEQRGSD